MNATFQTIVFYVFAITMVLSALRVITARNPVHAVLFLILAFFTASALWLLLEAEFLAITLVLVYVGAVMVLFLFVVMMLDLNFAKLREGFRQHLPVAAVVGVAMLAEMVLLLTGKAVNEGWRGIEIPQAAAAVSNSKALGRLIYTEYVLAFELAALILLVAIVAAIALTLRGRKESRSQVVSEQVRVMATDRLKIIKMDAVKEMPVPANAEGSGEKS